MEEIPAMRAASSPSTSCAYPLRMICQVWRVARSSVYAATRPVTAGRAPGKRGPKTRVSDADLVARFLARRDEDAFRALYRRRIFVRA